MAKQAPHIPTCYTYRYCGSVLEPSLERPMSDPAGVYIHIPVCESRCHCCNFATGGFEATVAERYVAALVSEIQRAQERSPGQVDSIYLGGGTPTTLTVQQLARILDAC